MNSNVGIFPGSLTLLLRDMNVIKKAAKMVDELIVAIGENSTKKYLFSLEDRKQWIEKTFEKVDNIFVRTYTGLTIDFAKK